MILRVFLILIVCMWCMGQDCGTPGQHCGDDKDCCGGCCINYKCINTYRDCHVKTTPCHDVDCPGGTECYTIDPPEECIGCDVETDCRPIGNYKY